MPNWCSNSIAFYSENNEVTLLEAFHSDLQKYTNYNDHKTGKYSDWVGHWLQSNRIDTEEIYSRGFIESCELYPDFVRVGMTTAWDSTPEIWDIMAQKYSLNYVFISEEPGCEVYINTDSTGRFFGTRFVLNYFDLEYLQLDSETLERHGERLRELSEETRYYDSFEEVMRDFNGFNFVADDIETLNKQLEKFNLQVYEFALE